MKFNPETKMLSEKIIKDMFERNGGLKMYDFKFNDDLKSDIENNINSTQKRKKANELLEKLNESNKKFDFSVSNADKLPEKISLDKKEFKGLDEKEIYDKASSDLEGLRQLDINNIKSEFLGKEDKLNKDKETLSDSAEASKQNIEGYFNTAKENASNQALKRGLARSSIIVNQLDAFDRSQIEEFMKVDKELTGKIDALNFEINGLGGELDKAMNDFNISYAVKLQDKINKLTTDLKDEEQKVIEYNNNIALKEAEFNKNIDELSQKLNKEEWQKGIDVAEVYGKYGPGAISKVMSDNAYNIAKSYFVDMTKEEILELLKDEDIKKALGNSYNTILKEING